MYYGFAEPVIIAGPRNAPRRPLIPPLAILFSSLFARSVRLPCPLLPHPPAPGAPLFPGPSRPFALRAIVVPLFLLSSVSLPFRRVTSTCPFYNHYRLSQLDRGRAASLPFRFHSFGRSSFPPPPLRFPRSCTFIPRISRPKFRSSPLRMTDEARCASTLPPVSSPSSPAEKFTRKFVTGTRANIRSRRVSRRIIYAGFTMVHHTLARFSAIMLTRKRCRVSI